MEYGMFLLILRHAMDIRHIPHPFGHAGRDSTLDNHRVRTRSGQAESEGCVARSHIRLFRRNPRGALRSVDRSYHTALHREPRPRALRLRTGSQGRSRILQFLPQGWAKPQSPWSRRHSDRHCHDRTDLPALRHADRRRSRRDVRSHNQHPRTRSRATGAGAVRHFSQRSRTQLRRDISVGRRRRHSRHHRDTQMFPASRHAAVERARRCRLHVHSGVQGLQSRRGWDVGEGDLSLE